MKMIHLTIRLPKEELERITDVLQFYPNDYKNKQEFIREAVWKLLNELLESD